jgi:hypothetical protein
MLVALERCGLCLELGSYFSELRGN